MNIITKKSVYVAPYAEIMEIKLEVSLANISDFGGIELPDDEW